MTRFRIADCGFGIVRNTIFAVGLALNAPPASLVAEAQQATKIYRVGYLANTGAPEAARFLDAFRQRLRDLGYVEGANLRMEYRWAEGRHDRLAPLAAELVRLKPDVIVAQGGAIQAAKNATQTIPIVMAVAGDPVAEGFVASLARPGGNITGLSLASLELDRKRLELLKETIPKAVRIAVLWNPTARGGVPPFKAVEEAAQALGVRTQSVEVRGPDDFEGAFSLITRGHAEALLVLSDPLTFVHRARIVAFTVKNRLPAMYGLTDHVNAGGLMAYAPSLVELYRRGAIYVDKILKGAKPADLPVEQPTKFELVINLRTAKALGLKIPQSVLVRADEVVR